MLKLSRKTLYALEAVVDIAYNAWSEPVQSKEIAERQGIPQRYLEQVMQHLVRAGILKGVRGPKGGYLLARERRRIKVGEIVRIISTMEANGESAGYESASTLGEQVIAPLLNEVQDELMDKLSSVSIDDLCRSAQANSIPRVEGNRLDFII